MTSKPKNKHILPDKWITATKDPLSCEEKIKLLNNNVIEIYNLAEEILDEALMTQGEIDLIGEDFSRDFDEELPPGDEVANEIEEIIRRKKRDSDKE